MGSTTLIDIIGSALIGGILLLSGLRMNDQATQTTYQSQENLTIQQNVTSLVNNILSDFRKIGYCANPYEVPESDSMIIHGDSMDIKFIASLYPETNSSYGLPDTVEWKLDPNKLFKSLSQGDTNVRILHRIVSYSNGKKIDFNSNLGVTQFNMLYFGESVGNKPGDTVQVFNYNNPEAPKLIEINLRVEPTAAYDTAYSSNYSVWRQIRLTSMNMINR